MADPSAADPPAVELDAKGKKLQLDAEKAKYREIIAKANQGALRALIPEVEGAPSGEVKLGEKAGALGPWLAHESIAKAAETIAHDVGATLFPKSSPQRQADDPDRATDGTRIAPTVTHASETAMQASETATESKPRVLVVDDRALLGGNVTARLVGDRLASLTERLEPLPDTLDGARTSLDAAVEAYRRSPGPRFADAEGGEPKLEKRARRPRHLETSRPKGESALLSTYSRCFGRTSTSPPSR